MNTTARLVPRAVHENGATYSEGSLASKGTASPSESNTQMSLSVSGWFSVNAMSPLADQEEGNTESPDIGAPLLGGVDRARPSFTPDI